MMTSLVAAQNDDDDDDIADNQTHSESNEMCRDFGMLCPPTMIWLIQYITTVQCRRLTEHVMYTVICHSSN